MPENAPQKRIPEKTHVPTTQRLRQQAPQRRTCQTVQKGSSHARAAQSCLYKARGDLPGLPACTCVVPRKVISGSYGAADNNRIPDRKGVNNEHQHAHKTRRRGMPFSKNKKQHDRRTFCSARPWPIRHRRLRFGCITAALLPKHPHCGHQGQRHAPTGLSVPAATGTIGSRRVFSRQTPALAGRQRP